MRELQPSGKIPVAHILMGVSGWAIYLFASYTPVMVLAIILSLLAVPRFIRGPWEMADQQITEALKRPITPSRRVEHVLPENEELLWETREHPISMLPWLLGGLAWTGGSVALGIFAGWLSALIVWGVGMLIVFWTTFLWQHDRICLTNKRILAVRGFFTLRHQSMPLRKLTDETLKVPWHSNLLAWLRLIKVQYGTLIVESAGQDQALSKVLFAPNAIQVNRIIMEMALK